MAPLSVNPVVPPARLVAPATVPASAPAQPAPPRVDSFSGAAATVPASAKPGISARQLDGLLSSVEQAVASAKAEPMPTTAAGLVAAYWRLGNALAQGEAALIGA